MVSHTGGQQATPPHCPRGSADAPLTARVEGSPANEGQVTRTLVSVHACLCVFNEQYLFCSQKHWPVRGWKKTEYINPLPGVRVQSCPVQSYPV